MQNCFASFSSHSVFNGYFTKVLPNGRALFFCSFCFLLILQGQASSTVRFPQDILRKSYQMVGLFCFFKKWHRHRPTLRHSLLAPISSRCKCSKVFSPAILIDRGLELLLLKEQKTEFKHCSFCFLLNLVGTGVLDCPFSTGYFTKVLPDGRALFF